MGAIASEPTDLMPMAAAEGSRRAFWRLIGFNGIRGGSINIPFTCGDAVTRFVEVVGCQYEVE